MVFRIDCESITITLAHSILCNNVRNKNALYPPICFEWKTKTSNHRFISTSAWMVKSTFCSFEQHKSQSFPSCLQYFHNWRLTHYTQVCDGDMVCTCTWMRLRVCYFVKICCSFRMQSLHCRTGTKECSEYTKSAIESDQGFHWIRACGTESLHSVSQWVWD